MLLRTSISSTVVELLEFLEGDRACVVFVASCHDIRDILLCHRVVKVVSKDLLEVVRLDKNSFITVENLESGQKFAVCPTAFVPSQVHYLVKIVSCETSTFIVIIVPSLELLLFLPLTDPIEAKVVNYALEIAPTDKLIATSEVLKRICQVALHVRR